MIRTFGRAYPVGGEGMAGSSPAMTEQVRLGLHLSNRPDEPRADVNCVTYAV